MIIRPPQTQQEWNLVRATWHDGVVRAAPKRTKARTSQVLSDIVSAALSRSVVLVAEAPGEPNILMGYIVGERGKPHLLHYWYVKNIYRGNGVGKSLLVKWANKETGHGKIVITWSPSKVFTDKAAAAGWGASWLEPALMVAERLRREGKTSGVDEGDSDAEDGADADGGGLP